MNDEIDYNAELDKFEAIPEEKRGVHKVNTKLEDGFFNDIDCGSRVKTENFRHRQAIQMSMLGASNEEIAATLGYSPGHVSEVLRQTWARARMINMARTTFDEIKALLEAAVIPQIKNIENMANDKTVPAAVRLAASNSLVDRAMGKAVQPIIQGGGQSSDLDDEELDRRISERLGQIQAN